MRFLLFLVIIFRVGVLNSESMEENFEDIDQRSLVRGFRERLLETIAQVESKQVRGVSNKLCDDIQNTNELNNLEKAGALLQVHKVLGYSTKQENLRRIANVLHRSFFDFWVDEQQCCEGIKGAYQGGLWGAMSGSFCMEITTLALIWCPWTAVVPVLAAELAGGICLGGCYGYYNARAQLKKYDNNFPISNYNDNSWVKTNVDCHKRAYLEKVTHFLSGMNDDSVNQDLQQKIKASLYDINGGLPVPDGLDFDAMQEENPFVKPRDIQVFALGCDAMTQTFKVYAYTQESVQKTQDLVQALIIKNDASFCQRVYKELAHVADHKNFFAATRWNSIPNIEAFLK